MSDATKGKCGCDWSRWETCDECNPDDKSVEIRRLRARLADSEALAEEARRCEIELGDGCAKAVTRALAAEARLSAATRVVEAAVLAAVTLEALRLSVRDELSAEVKLAIITATDALRAALREWKDGSKT